MTIIIELLDQSRPSDRGWRDRECHFPKPKGGSGFPTRVFAIVPELSLGVRLHKLLAANVRYSRRDQANPGAMSGNEKTQCHRGGD